MVLHASSEIDQITFKEKSISKEKFAILTFNFIVSVAKEY